MPPLLGIPHLGHYRFVQQLVAVVIHPILERYVDRVVLAFAGAYVIDSPRAREELAILV